jgi:glycosyltransferase involved in cell wall biosynthesis
MPHHPIAIKALRAERKLTGWRHLRHSAYAVKVLRTLRRFGLARGPLVIINDPEMTVYLKRHLPNTRIVHWFQNQLESSTRFRRAYRTAADITLGVSDFTSKWVGDYYNLDDVFTVYNGIDLDDFHPDFPLRAEAQRGVAGGAKAGAAPAGGEAKKDVPVVSFVGRTGIEKAPDLLLKAAIEVTKSTTAFKVLLVGSNHWDRFELDDYQRDLISLIQTLQGRGVEVTGTGHVGRAALPELMRTADIHVVPSRSDEPFGLTTLEGMATGLAVVASNTGGTPEVVGDAGYLFSRDSVSELADKLQLLVSNWDSRRKYGKMARERAAEFPWSRTWRGLETAACGWGETGRG